MEDLLTPQICMDIDETPLDVGKGDTTDDETNSESGEPEMDDDEKVKLLLEENFSDSSQVPEELTEFERDAKKNVFAIGEPAVQFQRLHCTSCNIHLGSAPIGHFNRYIHPLLKVLLCKPCYDFYCSGEFDKDEDGSEMYCRWCGQGGKVMCCAQCAYVFCQKCVRQNLGKRTLELIKDSDDWLCFGCNPTQLINLKIICTSLFEFVQEEIRLSKSLNNIERLKVDHTVCCQKVKAAKRKREEDTPYNPHKEWEEQQKAKRPGIIKPTITKPFTNESTPTAKTWNQKEEAEVVCTPDLLSLMEDDPPPLTSMPKSAQPNNSNTGNSILSKELTKAPLNAVKDPLAVQQKAVRTDGKKLYTIAPKSANMMMICNSNNLQKSAPNFIRLQTPAIKFVPSMSRTPIVNSIPAQITPGTKHEWYDKAATVVSTITGNLSATLMNLTREQRNAKTVEQLANIHNKLQELLSSSVNSLIQVRKNLRSEFLADLNKLKFSNSPSFVARPNISSNVIKAKPQSTSNKENDDDDVIIVNSETSSAKTAMLEPPPLVKLSKDSKSNTRPYLKVRSVSQLLTVSSECITIPDDPPGHNDDVIAVEEKDPLEIPDIPDHSEDKKSSISAAPENLNGSKEDVLKIKNALAENKIEELVKENMKYQVKDISECELKRILSVRVLLATNFQETLPENRLKTASWFVDSENVESANKTIENEITNTETGSDVSNKLASEPMDTSDSNKNTKKVEEKLDNDIEVDQDKDDAKDDEQLEKELQNDNSASQDFVEKVNDKHEESSNSIDENTDAISEKDEISESEKNTTNAATSDKDNAHVSENEDEDDEKESSSIYKEGTKLNDKEANLSDEVSAVNDEETNLNEEESNSNNEEVNLNEEEDSTDNPTNNSEVNSSQEKSTESTTKNSFSGSESDINNSNNENNSKSDAFSSDQITTDSGIELDSK